MCAGEGKRWGNYNGVPKHLIEINGETLIGRTTRLLKENGITDYLITSSDERYKQYGEVIPQSYNDCEIDRFEETDDKEVCYLYGDVYYTDGALKTIINTTTDDILFFGSRMEIFAVKVVNKKLFMKHKKRVKKLYLNGEINRCIGWEVYRSLYDIPFMEHKIIKNYYYIEDGTDDIDFPVDYEGFVKRMQNE
jgi:choline kinase